MNNDLEKLRKEVEDCKKCEFYKTRNHIVFGDGNENAKIMVIAEGPGYYEDLSGKTFMGASGKLLDKIFSACGFIRNEHIFIANIMKCRPPQNSTPTPKERAICLPYLLEQIRIINPPIIVLLGATALKGLIDPNGHITSARGRWIQWQSHWVMPTYHPSALLRDPNLKRDSWNDFKMVIDKYRELVDPDHKSPFH